MMHSEIQKIGIYFLNLPQYNEIYYLFRTLQAMDMKILEEIQLQFLLNFTNIHSYWTTSLVIPIHIEYFNTKILIEKNNNVFKNQLFYQTNAKC